MITLKWILWVIYSFYSILLWVLWVKWLQIKIRFLATIRGTGDFAKSLARRFATLLRETKNLL